MPGGLVYILISPNSRHIKIGGTEQALIERLRSINGTRTYAEHGPWELSDCIEVVDWQLVERRMHVQFEKSRAQDVAGVRELFDIPPSEARRLLRLTEPTLRVGHENTERLFKNRELQNYLFKLFEVTGLFGNLDIQGAWTFSLFPSTAGGRHFTLSIGTHEVAYAPRRRGMRERTLFMLHADQLVLDYDGIKNWIEGHDGSFETSPYDLGKEGAVSMYFNVTFAEAESLFAVPGIRRGLIAYWQDWLAVMRERGTRSLFARHHNYDAVQALVDFRRARRVVIEERCA